jgi:hypothetical protein
LAIFIFDYIIIILGIDTVSDGDLYNATPIRRDYLLQETLGLDSSRVAGHSKVTKVPKDSPIFTETCRCNGFQNALVF